jgi:adenosylcobinamide-GDP ribazoletransferase
MYSLKLAVGFLTAWPMRTRAPQPGDLGRSAVWFPAIGLALGLVLAAVHWGLSQLFSSPWLVAVLVVALWAALTGGLHLDGLADCGDGLLSAVSTERRLEIMHDPRLGSFGGLSLCLYLFLKVAAVASLPGATFLTVFALGFAPALARWLLLLVARQPSARPGGMGAAFALGLKPAIIAGAAILPLALMLLGGWGAVVAVGLALLVTFGIIRVARARLGGVTGDVFGLSVELSELAVLLVFAAHWPALLAR